MRLCGQDQRAQWPCHAAERRGLKEHWLAVFGQTWVTRELGDQLGAGRGGEPGHRGEPAADDDALVG